jgi:hypothetical protein
MLKKLESKSVIVAATRPTFYIHMDIYGGRRGPSKKVFKVRRCWTPEEIQELEEFYGEDASEQERKMIERLWKVRTTSCTF